VRPWDSRVTTDRSLLNPAFLGLIAAEFVRDHQRTGQLPLVDITIVGACMAATGSVRMALPGTTAAKLVNWVITDPVAAASSARAARSMTTHARRGVLFSLAHGWTQVQDGRLGRGTAPIPVGTGDEMLSILKSARFLGRWFAKSGDPATVLTMLGVSL
jgi:hypothetical protein